MDVTQEWKGGVSGGTAVQWRESLQPGQNSLWKVIDRYTDDCRGIWHFMQDGLLKQQCCSTWQAQFLGGMTGVSDTLKDELQDGCQSQSMDMQEVRQKVIEESKAAQKAEVLQKATAMPTLAPTPVPTCGPGQYAVGLGCQECRGLTRRRRADLCTPCSGISTTDGRRRNDDDACQFGSCGCVYNHQTARGRCRMISGVGGDGALADCRRQTKDSCGERFKNAFGEVFCAWKWNHIEGPSR